MTLVHGSGFQLVHRALVRLLIGTPAQEFCPVTKAITGKVVIMDLAHQAMLKRNPFIVAVRPRPAAWATGRLARKAGTSHQRFENRLELFAFVLAEAGTEAYMIQVAMLVE